TRVPTAGYKPEATLAAPAALVDDAGAGHGFPVAVADLPEPRAWLCGGAGDVGDEQAGGDHAKPEAEREREGAPAQGWVEGRGEMGACQGAHVGEGAGEGQERAGQQQQDSAGLQSATAQ